MVFLPHRFALGQWVRLKSRAGLPLRTPEAFRITGFMPPQHVVSQYRIRSDDERYERVVMEDELETIASPETGEAVNA